MGILLYPYFLVVFWYHEFLPRAVKRSFEIFMYTIELLSVPLLVATFFQPLKGEYREGLVIFSIVMGILVKSLILIVAFSVLSIVLTLLIFTDFIIAALPLLLIILAL